MDDAKSIRPCTLAKPRFASVYVGRYSGRCALLPTLWLTLGFAGVLAASISAAQSANANPQPIENHADSPGTKQAVPAVSDASCHPAVVHPPHIGAVGDPLSAKLPSQLFVNCSLAEQSVAAAVPDPKMLAQPGGLEKPDRKDLTGGGGQVRANNPLAWVAEIIFSVLALGSFMVAALLLWALYYRLTLLDEHVGVETAWGGLGGGLGGWRTSTSAALAVMVVLFAVLACLFSHQLLSVITPPVDARSERHSALNVPKAAATPKAE